VQFCSLPASSLTGNHTRTVIVIAHCRIDKQDQSLGFVGIAQPSVHM
jgi:hypothetical protein